MGTVVAVLEVVELELELEDELLELVLEPVFGTAQPKDCSATSSTGRAAGLAM